MELKAEKRTVLGKGVNALRKNGMLPAEVYGEGIENSHITVDAKAFMKLYRAAGRNAIINLTIEKHAVSAIVSEVQIDRISGKPIAIDFHAVKKGEKITVDVPIVLTGEAPATKAGLDVIQALSSIEIETLPTHIPREFFVDISALTGPDDVITVKDISAPQGVKILESADAVIVSVTEKQKEEETPPPPVAEATEEKKPEAPEKS